MANKNNDGVDNALDCSTETGSDKSFVGKFVSGLISNTPLSKWFKSEETTRSATRRRDEDDDDPYTLQPPIKRAKLPSQHGMERNNYSAHTFGNSPVIVRNTSNNSNNVASKVFNSFPEPVAGPSGIKSRKFFMGYNSTSNASTGLDTSVNQDVVNGDNDSDSEESTSGYSSAPRVTKVESNIENKEVLNRAESLDRSRLTTRSLFSSTHDVSNSRSLFSERSLSPQINTSLSSRRPNFNASTFGSPSFVDRTLSTKRIMSSPFYNGKTIYGGASAYTKSQSSANLNTSTRSSVLIKPVNQKAANDSTAMSKTARRILSTLEQYSTPISDAKKIPVATKSDNKKGILSKYVGANPYLVRQPKTASNKELQVPSIPELLQLKQKERLQNSTVSVRQIATSSKSTLNKPEYNIRTEEDAKSRNKHCNKMKSSVVSVRQKTQPEENHVEVKLPKVALPITTLPKFDFVVPPPQSHEKTKSSPPKTVVESKYQFAKPLIISESSNSVPAINCFKFSEPVSKKVNGASCLNFKMPEKPAVARVKSNGESVKSVPQSGSVNDVFNKTNNDSSLDKFKPAEGTWECSTCLVRNKADKNKCVACETSKDCNIAKDKSEIAVNGPGFGNSFKLSKGKWECGTCMVRNDDSSQNCIACTTPRVGAVDNLLKGQVRKSEKESSKSETSSLNNTSFGNSFKPASDTWECSVCLIRNKNELEKCAACETSRGAKPGMALKPVSSFGDKFKPPPTTWECPTCMIRNNNDLNKCVACETAKPGVKAAPTQPAFTFGIKPLEWECKGCKAKNVNATKCASCHKSKEEPNGFGNAFKLKGSEWECSSCMVRNKSEIVTCACCGVPKPGSVNIEKLNESAEKKPVISFNFGINQSGSEFKSGIPPTTEKTAAPLVFGFGEPAAAKSAPPAESFSFGIKTQESPKNYSNPLLKPNEKLPEKAEPAPTGFKFGVDNQKTPEPSKPKEVPALPEKILSPNISWKVPTLNGEVKTKDITNETSNLFGTPQAPSTDQTFQFKPTPSTSNATTTSNSLFKFGSDPTPPSNKRPMDSNKDFSASNGFGSPAKLPSFEATKAIPTFSTGITGSSKPFSFGSGEPAAKNASFAFEQNPSVAHPAAPTTFKFGSNETSAPAPGGGFNFSVTSVPSTGFSFGAKSEPAASNPAPVFGAASTTGAKNGSYFGTMPNNNSQKAIFTFGASQMNPPSFPQNPTGFNFGSAAPAPASGGFNFTGAPPTFNLSDGNASTAQPVRKMRKAVRRTTQR